MSAAEVTTLPIAQIRRDGGTQPRGGINPSTAQKYAQMRREGRTPPAVVVFYDGENYWLGDGFHRIEGSLLAGFSDQPTEIRQGTQRDAIFFSLGANAYHGLALSDDDRRRAAIRLLLDEEWGAMSSRAIADHVGYRSKTSVNNIRQQLREKGALGPMTEIVGTDGKTYPIPIPEPPAEDGAVVGEDNGEGVGADAASTNPFPEDCKTGEAREAYANTLCTVAEIEALLAWPELQKSAASKIEFRRKKILHIEEADTEEIVTQALYALPYNWPEVTDPGVEGAVLARLEDLAGGEALPTEPGMLSTDEQQIERVRGLSSLADVEEGLLQPGLSRAVRRALLTQRKLLGRVSPYTPLDADTPPGVRRAVERRQAEAEAAEAARAERDTWLTESMALVGQEAQARIAETDDADLLASWCDRETRSWVEKAHFYAPGRAEVRRALWERLVDLEVRPTGAEECPLCPGCFATASYTGAEPSCPHCCKSPADVRRELNQLAQAQAAAKGEAAPAPLLTLADRVQAADDRQMHAALRRMIPELAEHDSLRLLCAGDESLAERLPDMDTHELRELYYLGRVGDPNRVLLRKVEEALAAAEAEAAAVLAPAAGAGDQGPGPGPMVQAEDEDGLPALIRSRIHQGALGYWLCREQPAPEVFHNQLSHVEDAGDIEEALAVAWWLRLPLVYTDLLWARRAELDGEGGSAVAWPDGATAAGKVSVVELLAALDEATGRGAPPAWLEAAPPTLATAMMAWMAHQRPRPVLPKADAEAAK